MLRSVYDESKRFSEAATMAFHRTPGLRTRIARIFNCYGPGMSARDGRDWLRRMRATEAEWTDFLARV